MKYVKFISKPDNWFKEGSEAFFDSEKSRRMTIEEYDAINNDVGYTPASFFVGIRVCEDNPNERNMGCFIGEERIDGEWCPFDEFDISFTDEYLEMFNHEN